MWYAEMIGQTVPLLRILPEENCYMSQEPAGYSNIVKFGDAEIVEPDLKGEVVKGIKFRCIFCGKEHETVEECNVCEESH